METGDDDDSEHISIKLSLNSILRQEHAEDVKSFFLQSIGRNDESFMFSITVIFV